MTRRKGRWAGQHRASGKNIGVDAYRIPTELRELIDNGRYWIANETYGPDEVAARFHHKLVWIHCYPNGNGRHARLATDLLLIAMGQQVFSWGSANLVDEDEKWLWNHLARTYAPKQVVNRSSRSAIHPLTKPASP